MIEKTVLSSLEEKAYEMRKLLVELCHRTGVLHIGGDLSSSDIMTALYFYKMKIDPANPKAEDRDRFIISKGHGGATQYLAMGMLGMIDLDELFSTYRQLDSKFGMHPCSNVLPQLEVSTGSLGHGLPLAVGFALAAKMDRRRHRVYVLCGDGETNEGSVWEAAMAAAHYGLGNLVCIVDKNNLSLDGPTKDVMNMEPYADKWRAFNWNVLETDGNDMRLLCETLDAIPDVDSDRPTLIVAHTVKGKGISFMEDRTEWHAGTIPTDEMYRQCLAELERSFSNGKRGDGHA